MKKLSVLLVFCIAVMVVVDGLLVCERGILQKENQNLRNEIFDVKSELLKLNRAWLTSIYKNTLTK